MSEPIVEQIAQEIAARVNEITVAAGWNQTLKAVRSTRMGLADDAVFEDGTVLIVQDDESLEEGEELSGAPASLPWIQPFSLGAFIVASDFAKEAIDRRINLARADLEKKLREDPTRGGLAIDTRIRPSYLFENGPQQTGVVVVVDVHYRVSEDDPYTLG